MPIDPIREALSMPWGGDLERFWGKVEVGHSLGCWLWTAATSSGYGVFKFEGATVKAHRFAYELLIGPLPQFDTTDPLTVTLDHLCRVRRCVNPDHLEPVAAVVNKQRGSSGPALNARKAECPRGHRYTAENTRVRPNGYRICRTCHRIDERERRRSRHAA